MKLENIEDKIPKDLSKHCPKELRGDKVIKLMDDVKDIACRYFNRNESK